MMVDFHNKIGGWMIQYLSLRYGYDILERVKEVFNIYHTIPEFVFVPN